VVTFNTLGNVRVGNIIGNGQALTGLTGANVTGQVGNALVAGTVYTAAQPNITSVGTLTSLGVSGNLTAPNVIANTGAFYGNAAGLTNIPSGNISGQVANALVAGTVYTAAQPNITSVGKLTSLLAGSDSAAADFTNAIVIAAKGNTGVTSTASVGLVGEGISTDSGNSSAEAIGLFGVGSANGSAKGTGVQGTATVASSADTGSAVGVRGIASTTHSGGYNIGVLGNAAGSGVGNYAFYVQSGDIASIEANVAWDLYDNSAAALAFNSTGKANILRVSTLDGSEGVGMSGTLSVTGNASVGGIKTDNYYYANGSPVDFQQAGGSNTQIQFNDADSFGGSAAFTFDKTSNLVTMSGNLSVANVQATGAITGATVTSNGNANVGNLGTAGLITATGNVSGGNLTTGGVVAATGNVSGGNLTTGGVVAATGNVSGGNLTTGGALSVTGNANVGNLGTGGLIVATGNVTGGNINTAGKVVASTLESNVTTGTAPFTVASTTKVTNLNADLLDGFSTATAATANTVVIRDADGSFSANVVTATLSGAATTAGTVTTAAQPNITSVGTLSSLAVTGNGTFGNVYANAGTIGALTLKGEGGNISNVTAGNITGQVANALVAGTVYTNAQPNITSVGTLSSLSVTGNVSAGNVSGTLLTGTLATAAQPNVTSVGTLTVLGVNGNITAANITANTGVFTGNGSGLSQLAGGNVTGQVANALVAGTVYTAAQPNITSVGTLSSLAVTANVAAGNLTTTGVLSVTGTGVSSIAGNLDMTSNTIINLATPTNASDAATKQYVDDLASTALVYHEAVLAATTDTLATTTGGTITYNNGASGVGANLVTTGSFNLIDTANVQIVGTRILVKNEANAAHNGVYTWANTTTIVRATDADTYGPGADQLSLNNYFFVSGGSVNKGSAYVVDSPSGTITFGTSNILFAQFSSSQVYSNGTGLGLSGTVFSVNASQTQVTALGTVTTGTWNSLVGSSATFAAGLSGANLASITGANVTGTVPAATVAGTVTTAAQPNITSVGTLTGLGVNGTVTAVAFTANTGVFTGNGSGLSAIAGANVTGTVGSATTAGTVTTAAQPNITSVGTLSSLAVTGNASAGNLNTAGAVVASTLTSNVTTGTAPLTVTSTTRVANLNVAYANVADNINVTTQSSGNAFLVFANALTGNVAETANAAFVANTSNGALYATTFIGAVSGNGAALTNLNASNISTGTLAQARLANSSLTVNGTSIALGGTGTITANTTQTLTLGSFLTGTSFNGGTAVTAAVDATSANTASKVVARDASGNFSAGTITATLSGAATTAGTVTTAAQPNITSVGTLTGLTVSGNLVCGGFFDASVNAAVSAAGTAQGNATVIASEINVVSTVASGAGVALPTAVAGVRVTLINTAANTLLVYPASGGAINSLATNAAYSLPAGGRLEYVAVSTTQWYTLNATYG
jgi:hypothetical protein